MSCHVNDLSGKVFGKLTVIRDAGRDKWGQVIWLCRCDCGNEKTIVGGNLRRKHGNVSCGCVQTEHALKACTKHGHTKNRNPTREYRSWQSMKRRCLEKAHVHYGNYGGRGITICERWVDSFENFFSDMGECPAGYTLDRIDPNGNYESSNCRWASWSQQASNKRKCQPLTLPRP
jgi:hypothetical protein